MYLRNTIAFIILSLTVLVYSMTVIASDEAKMKTFKGATSMELASMNIEGVNAFLADVVSSNDSDAPITCGLFRMEKGNSLQYTYTYDEAKIIVEGEMTIAEEGGETFHAVAGDVVYFDEGATITFSSDSSGVGFYCGQRAQDEV
ncbi:MAG: cupin domain-containing protein [Gammaproteobacteria bacterium]|nr:cupin domain-containing protein [Gammaproteobacteria bacterium]